jgi:TP901 family phage tail tape measure protein
LGIQNDKILDFTKTMAQLGMTTNMAAQDAAMQLARFANITKMSQDDFDELGSVIVDLGNNMATTEGEIVAMAMRLAGAGTAVGMTEQNIMGMAAALSSVGIKAEAGGTAFSKVMLEMNSSVAAGGEELQQYARVVGLTATEFADMFRKDTASAVMTFISGLGDMKARGEDVTPVLDDLGLMGIRITDALLRASGAVDLFDDAQRIAATAWEENTALQDEADYNC